MDNEFEESLNKLYLTNNFTFKCKNLTQDEKFVLGDKLMKLVEEIPIVYRKVSFRFRDRDTDEEINGNYIFPDKIYSETLKCLNEILNRPCNCSNPEESHKWCNVDLNTEYSTFDAWYKYASDHVMVYPSRIEEIAKELECPYKLLSDEKIMDEIIDWVDTGERLGWTEPPEKRKHFIETCTFKDTPDTFDPDADHNTLFEIFCNMVKSEKDERKKIDFLWSIHSMIFDFGTNDSYCVINSKNKQSYLVLYKDNKESLDYLYDILRKEEEDNNQNKGQRFIELYSTRCRCGQVNDYNNTGKHEGSFYKKLITKKELEINHLQSQIRNIVNVDKIKDVVKDKCPYYCLDNIDTILH